MLTVAGYARTSWEEQVLGTFPSLPAQAEALSEFAMATGLRLDKVYEDEAISRERSTLGGIVEVLDRARDGADWAAVLVLEPTRLDVPGLTVDPAGELAKLKVRILEADLETAEGLAKVTPAVRRAAADRERADADARRREVAARLFKGRCDGARAGKHQSGPAPYGYRRDLSQRSTKGALLVPDPDEAEVVRLIFREYLRLKSMGRLIKLLDERGLLTRRGKSWSRAGVSWVLRNETYVGRVHFGDVKAKGIHEPLVAPITFNRAGQLLRKNRRRPKRSAS